MLITSTHPLKAADAERPNLIVIMTDDLGYGDVGCYGAKDVSTPHIDRLAKEGIRFTSGYASASTCTPTRFSLLTGKYAFRQKGTGIAAPNATSIIKPGTPTLPSMLQKAGYKTAIVGKWHLGLGALPKPNWSGEIKPGPLELGFDYCFLMPTTGDRVPCVYVENHRIVNLDPKDPVDVFRQNPDGQPTGITHRKRLKMDWSHGHNHSIINGISRIGFMIGGHKARWRDEDMADVFTAQAVKFLQNHQKEHAADPFFLFFSTHDIHVPRMPHERFQGKTTLGYRGDAIVQMDWCVGQILKTLEELKLTEKTMVVFCSDNGPVLDDGYKDGAVTKIGTHRAAGTLKGGKYTIYEGGTRTPFITWWPKRIQPGVSDEIVSTIDLYASFAKLTEQKLPKQAAPDSFDVLNALLGKEDAHGRDHIVQHGRGLAIRYKDWKLLEHPSKKQGTKKNEQKRNSKLELFHLENDLGEAHNLTEQHPEKVELLQKLLNEIREKEGSRPVD